MKMTREQLLAELRSSTYVMIRPSPIEGIGVFALQDIPKGCREMFSPPLKDHDEWMRIPKSDIDALPPHARKLVENYCLYDAEHYFIPEYGFKKMDLVNFLNHSDSPNIISINDGEFFEATREIKAGEELLIDYGGLVADEEE